MSDKEIRKRVMLKFLRESSGARGIDVFWSYVQAVAKNNRFGDGFVEWSQVRLEVEEALASRKSLEGGVPTDEEKEALDGVWGPEKT